MLVPLSWLRDFAPFELDPSDLAATFDDLGMVVEGMTKVGEGLDGVVVARVSEIGAIEGADKIRRVVVDAGGEAVEVVCGAWNFDVGAVVPLATVGAVLPGGFKIERRKMKGVVSNGMICSARELDLGEDAAGIMVLGDRLEPGTPLTDALGLTGDVVYDLAIEGNRPDANCVAGVARDAAARLGLPFTLPEPAVAESGQPVGELATVALDAPVLCPRFTARVITGVAVGPAPDWVARRLTLAGMRPINNVVDASNYVMLELGQPTHPYDLDRLPGRGLSVRRGRPGEVVVTLDDVERRVGEDDCLICDAEGEPVGIGGVMGGASSEIADETSVVMLEAAYFDPMSIARTAKRLKLRTEASARFERGVDPDGIERAVARFCEILGTGQVAPGMLDETGELPVRQPIRVRTARVNSILGTEITDEEIGRYLRPIGFAVNPADGGVQEVTAPSFRPDVTREVEVIEEVARHHGYSKITRTVPRSHQVGTLTRYQRERRFVREVLVGLGINEAQTPSLVGPGDHERAGLDGSSAIHASDPLIQEESILRQSLLPGLLRTLGHNEARRYPGNSFFEVGPVFVRRTEPARIEGIDAALPDEREHVAVAVADGGAVEAKRVLDTLVHSLRLAGVELEPSSPAGLHPTRTATVSAGGARIGVVGEVDPDVSAAWGVEGRVGWVDLELAALLGAPRRPEQERPLSKYPSSDIDLAFVVDDRVAAGAVEATLRDAAGDLLVDLRLFDVYRGSQLGDARRSLAYRLRFNAFDRTLTDEEVASVRQRCITAVESTHGATLRG